MVNHPSLLSPGETDGHDARRRVEMSFSSVGHAELDAIPSLDVPPARHTLDKCSCK
jgi:hypothetical protein